MNIGQFTIIAACITSVLTAFFFYRDGHRNRFGGNQSRQDKQSWSVKLFYIVVLLGGLASSILYYALFTHQFQYAYVTQFSSSTQPFLYNLSAFWAGQEGTFLLWALLTSVMGLVFLRTAKPVDGYAMSVVSVYLAFLYFLMMVKSPFEVLASVPKDGTGMNPLLQNPWMAIHPPLLFVGYAATVFPFGLVVSALARKSYDQWNSTGFAWTLFASVMLGAGIIIGGFWAYEVLGWGGYWGWDPVENSSLVPWLILLALIHGLLVQKTKGSLVRTNFFLAIITFLLVLYATFLTRSGVLADFSVHSFTDLGINNYLIGIMVAGVVLSFGLFFTRFKSIKAPSIDIKSINRELMLVLSLFVLCLAALFTFVGMSSPIITGIFGKASQVDITFYNKVNMPVAIGMALLLGITPFLGWVEEHKSAFLKRLSMPLALTALSCVIAYVAGVTSVMLMLFVGSAAFGLISNVIVAFRQYRSGWMNLGGPISHIGVGLLLIGIVGSGVFDTMTQIALNPGEPKQAFGYQFVFRGVDETAKGGPRTHIEVSDGNTIFMSTPKLYFSEYNQAVMREPDIKIFPLKDLYISPLELRSQSPEHTHPTLELAKGESAKFGDYTIQFVRFETGRHSEPGNMVFGALLNVNIHGTTHEIMPQIMINAKGEQQFAPANLPTANTTNAHSSNQQVFLAAMNVEQKKILLEMSGHEEDANAHAQTLIVEISTKPLMMVVWTGVVLILAGSAMAFKRRLVLAERSISQ